MSNRRDDFSAQVKRTLAEQVGYLCSNPSCARPTIGLEERTKDKRRSVGIAAASPRGPRYDSKQTPEERSSIDNGIWLCQDCARKIDENIDVYAVEELQNWKKVLSSTPQMRWKKAIFIGRSPVF